MMPFSFHIGLVSYRIVLVLHDNVSVLHQHRFQIFKKLGVKFNDLFLRTKRLQRNLNYFTVNLPLDFSEIFNILRITVFFFFFKNSRKFSKKYFKLS